ncbi:hypothetical protein IR128_14910, partial [Staphylococcus lentus]|nr:hypothetical protein [Mammaliicoccus lentus]
DRIKQLKDLREAAIIGSSDYKSYDTQIKKLEARLPKHTTGDKADSAAKQLRERQLEADRKLEADRIAVLEEGYEKRKRTLSLQ